MRESVPDIMDPINYLNILKACAMMNNIQQTRIQLEKTYLSMGGKELEEDAAGILTQLQSTLTRDLDQLAHKFSER